MSDFTIHDHPVQRTPTDEPGAYPVCPSCFHDLAYEDQEFIAARTFTITYWCEDCDHEVVHEYRLEAVRTVKFNG